MIFLEDDFINRFTLEQRNNMSKEFINDIGLDSELNDLFVRIFNQGFINTVNNDKDIQRWFYFESCILHSLNKKSLLAS